MARKGGRKEAAPASAAPATSPASAPAASAPTAVPAAAGAASRAQGSNGKRQSDAVSASSPSLLKWLSVAVAVAAFAVSVCLYIYPLMTRSHTPSASGSRTSTSASTGSEYISQYRPSLSAATAAAAEAEAAAAAAAATIAAGSASNGTLDSNGMSPVSDFKWGTYRPSVYFGVRARSPTSPQFGLLWSDPYHPSPADTLRHETRDEDKAERIQWDIHDGKHYGVQTILDGALNITTEFIQKPEDENSFYARVRVTHRHVPKNSPAGKIYYSGFPGAQDTRKALKEGPYHAQHPPAVSLFWYWLFAEDEDDALLSPLPSSSPSTAQPNSVALAPTDKGAAGAAKATEETNAFGNRRGYPLADPITTRLVLKSSRRAYDFTSSVVSGEGAGVVDTRLVSGNVTEYLNALKGVESKMRLKNQYYRAPPRHNAHRQGHYGGWHPPSPPAEAHERHRYLHTRFTPPRAAFDEVSFSSYRVPKEGWRVHDIATRLLANTGSKVVGQLFSELRRLTDGIAAVEDDWDAEAKGEQLPSKGVASQGGAPKGQQVALGRQGVGEWGAVLGALDNTVRPGIPPSRHFGRHGQEQGHMDAHRLRTPSPAAAGRGRGGVKWVPPPPPPSKRVVLYQTTLQLPAEVEFTLTPAHLPSLPPALRGKAASKSTGIATSDDGFAPFAAALDAAVESPEAIFTAPPALSSSASDAKALPAPATPAAGSSSSSAAAALKAEVPVLRQQARERFYERFSRAFPRITASSAAGAITDAKSGDKAATDGSTIATYTPSDVTFAQTALSSLLGGIGYWHGRGRLSQRVVPPASDAVAGRTGADSRVDTAFRGYYDDLKKGKYMQSYRLKSLEQGRDEEAKARLAGAYRPLAAPAQTLFSATPSRTCFPRGFLWDEGMHALLYSRWDPSLAQETLRTWAGLVDSDGWLPREQILGDEPRDRVPEEFQTQRSDIANPPTQILALVTMLRHTLEDEAEALGCALPVPTPAPAAAFEALVACASRGGSGKAEDITFSPRLVSFVRFLADVLPSYRRHVLWLLASQASPELADPDASGLTYEEVVAATKEVDAGVAPATVAGKAARRKRRRLQKQQEQEEGASVPKPTVGVPRSLPWLLSRDLSWLNSTVLSWKARTRDHGLSSGLDDYPRLPVGPSPFVLAEGHVDLQAWGVTALRGVADLTEALVVLAPRVAVGQAVAAAAVAEGEEAVKSQGSKSAPKQVTVAGRTYPVTGGAAGLTFPASMASESVDYYTVLTMHEEAAARGASPNARNALPPLVPPPFPVLARAEESGEPLLDFDALKEDVAFFRNRADALLDALERLMFDPVTKKFGDFAVISGNYDAEEQDVFDRYIRKGGRKDGAKEITPGRVWVHHDGYVSLLPLFLGLIPVETDSVDTPSRLLSALQTLSKPELLTEFGIRSLSRADPLFGAGENYWRGNVWVPINVVALQGLSLYAQRTEGAMRNMVLALRDRLRKGIIRNLSQQFAEKGFLFESYDGEKGQGVRCKPFNGWSALVVLLMDGSV